MDSQSELPLSKVLENIVKSFFKIFSDIGSLAKAEARLAKQSMVRIFFLSVLLFTLLTTTWLCFLGLTVAYLMYLKFSLLMSLFIVTALTALLAMMVGLIILRLKNNLFFRATRRQINQTTSLLKGS
jgi:hypothetical protein